MSVAEKLITIANNTPLVCEKLYTEKTVSGNPVTVVDVSSVEHSLDIKLISDTITDFSGIKVNRYGKNLFTTKNKSSSYSSTIEIIDTNNCIITAQKVKYTCYYGFYIENPKKDFTISLKYLTENTPVLSAGRVNCVYVWGTNSDRYDSTAKLITSRDSNATDGEQGDFIFKISAASCVGYKYVYIWWYGYNTSLSEVPENSYKVILNDIQVEIGAFATEYEPYKEPQTAIANTEGVVEELNSLSPNITLVSNDENVIIECTYRSGDGLLDDEKYIELQHFFENAKKIIQRNL